MDLVGIEPTTSPARPGRAHSCARKRQSVLESIGEISNSLVVARVGVPHSRWRMIPDKREPTVLGHGWKEFVRVGVLSSEPSASLHSQCRISSKCRFAVCRQKAFEKRRNWWTWSGSNRRPLPCHGSALPAAPQAHVRGHYSCLADDLNHSRRVYGDSQRVWRTILPVCLDNAIEGALLNFERG